MSSLSDVCTPRRAGDHYQLDVEPGWRMGRGAFGGLVVAALIRAIEQHTGDAARTVRSVTAELPGPVEHGAVDIAVETLRRGNNVSTLRAAMSQHGEIKSHAVAIVASARSGGDAATWNDLARPEAPDWTDLAPFSLAAVGPWPEFAQHFEYRLIDGVPGSAARRTLGWIRARDPGAPHDAAYLAAMIDAWFPVAFVRLGARPMATIAFTLDVAAGAEAIDPTAPLLYRGVAPVCSEGYALETRELWTADGRLLAINHQTFVIIR
jgi:acyl-CoA thioesterase